MQNPTAAGWQLRPMRIADYDEVLALWQKSEGVGLGESDDRAAIAAYLARNPGLSLVAVAGKRTVGAVLCGHDGRRGYLHHLAVAVSHRRQGIARALVEEALAGLKRLSIPRCNLFLYAHNQTGRAFWLNQGWQTREDLVIVQKTVDSRAP